jgi:plastocyanin
VTANETEFSISLSRSSFAAGTYVFVVRNRGTTTHALGISGPGINTTTDDVAPGDSSSLTVTLRAGSYDVYCPVANHKMLGMDVHVTVA